MPGIIRHPNVDFDRFAYLVTEALVQIGKWVLLIILVGLVLIFLAR